MSYASVYTHVPGALPSLNQRLDGPLLDVCQHEYDHLSTTLNHAKDRWLLGFKCPSAALAFERHCAGPATPFFATSSGLPLCPATM